MGTVRGYVVEVLAGSCFTCEIMEPVSPLSQSAGIGDPNERKRGKGVRYLFS